MKRFFAFFMIAVVCFLGWKIVTKKEITGNIKGYVNAAITKPKLIDEKGNTVASRVKLPEGFQRVKYPVGSFQEYLRNYKLKEYGTPIINYDGSSYFAQHWHEGILEVPVPKNGLQQCADALIRIRSEYLWEHNRKDEIGFNFTSGDYCSWKYYAEGYRPRINGNHVSFHKSAIADNSKSNFYKYLNLIYTYAGTSSLHTELSKVKVDKLQIGDMLVKPGFPGHIEIIVDQIKNEKGEYLYVLAQGNTPAQNVCLLRNFEDEYRSPWYAFEENQPVNTPSYYFDKALFVRFK